MPVPERLRVNGRPVCNDFTEECLLYRGFSEDDIDETNESIKLSNIRFPDLSSNWNRFSEPQDVRCRSGHERDGCYSVKVKDIRKDRIATPVHDPITLEADGYENYSHVEVRLLRHDDPNGYLPPHGRNNPKSKSQHNLRLEYRHHIVTNLAKILEPISISSTI